MSCRGGSAHCCGKFVVANTHPDHFPPIFCRMYVLYISTSDISFCRVYEYNDTCTIHSHHAPEQLYEQRSDGNRKRLRSLDLLRSLAAVVYSELTLFTSSILFFVFFYASYYSKRTRYFQTYHARSRRLCEKGKGGEMARLPSFYP